MIFSPNKIKYTHHQLCSIRHIKMCINVPQMHPYCGCAQSQFGGDVFIFFGLQHQAYNIGLPARQAQYMNDPGPSVGIEKFR